MLVHRSHEQKEMRNVFQDMQCQGHEQAKSFCTNGFRRSSRIKGAHQKDFTTHDKILEGEIQRPSKTCFEIPHSTSFLRFPFKATGGKCFTSERANPTKSESSQQLTQNVPKDTRECRWGGRKKKVRGKSGEFPETLRIGDSNTVLHGGGGDELVPKPNLNWYTDGALVRPWRKTREQEREAKRRAEQLELMDQNGREITI